MDNPPTGPPVPPPPPPPTAFGPPQQAPGRAPGGLSALKKVGYFVGGTVWIVLNGLPVAPVGLIGILGVISEKRKLLTALLVLGGVVLGGIGTGISVRITTDPPSTGFHFNVGLHPKFNDWLVEAHFKRSGVLDEGREVAEKAIESLRNGDVETFLACFDPTVFEDEEEVRSFFREVSEELGTIESFEYVELEKVRIVELKRLVPLLRYQVHGSRSGPVKLEIGLHKTSDGWRAVSFYF
jgi:hypothetical protein